MTERRRALIIANSEYEDADLRQLVAPAQDAEALERVLGDPQVGGFDVKTLLNRPAREVSEVVERFFLDRTRDDLLLLYFSGHGLRADDGQLYFATVDTRLVDHVRPLRATAVGADFITDVMRGSNSRRQVLVLDCCYSGAFSRALIGRGGLAVNIQDQFEAGRGLVVLTASNAIQQSFEKGDGEPSVFTRHLVRGVETGEADLDGDGHISLDELYEYVHDRVRDETTQQRPMKWAFDVEGEIVIAQVRKVVLKPVKLPPELQDAIENTAFRGVRRDAVQELARLLRGEHKGRALAAREALLKLKDHDDSLLVRDAAARCLAAYDEEQRQESRAPDEVSERERQAPAPVYDPSYYSPQRIAQRAAREQRREHAEQERLEREKAEQERLKAEAERVAQQKAEQERQEQERAEAAERERQAKAQAEQERLAREKAWQERLKAEAERVAQQKAEQERRERERAEGAERETRLKEQAEKDQLAREEAGPEPPTPHVATRTAAPAPAMSWPTGVWGAGAAVGAAPAKVSVPPVPEASDVVEEALKGLAPGQILFNPSEEMQVGVTKRVEARIGKGLTQDLSAGLKGRGLAQTEEILVGTFVRVRLRGSNFDVKSLTHEEQAVGENDFTLWAWEVTPRKAGSQLLSLQVTVRIKIPNDGEEAKDNPVFDRRIKVRVNLGHTIKNFTRRYWQWLASAIVIPIIVWGFGSVVTSRRTRAVITQGDSYYAKGAYEEALRAYQEGLARNPENSVLQARIKRTREAVAFRKSQIDTLTSQGDSDYARGAYDEAIGAYQKGLSLDPGNTELQGKIQRARKKQVDALTRRGDSYYEDGQYNQAIGQYQKALDIDPNNQALAERKTRARNARDWEQAHGPMKPGSLVAHPKN